MSDDLTLPLLPDQVAIPLEGLAGRINEAHSLTVEHAGKAIEHTCRAGEWLLQAKRQVRHGEWQSWLRVAVENGATLCEPCHHEAHGFFPSIKSA